VNRRGFITLLGGAPMWPRLTAFHHLKATGYVEGQNVAIAYRSV
jgi:hypothetical protein